MSKTKIKAKRYAVHIDVCSSITVEVEADSPEAAEGAAWEKVRLPSLCRQCAGEIDVHDFTGTIDIEEIEP